MIFLFNVIFIVTSLILGVAAVMLIWRNMMDINKLNKPKRTIQDLHPELENVQPGDELMTVNFGEENEEEDPLYKSLKDRINELNEEDDDDDEDDDDGDVIVRV
mgnify:FL=1|jgi:hypothetical protein|tara:strand:+ start:375 stop:686 length:312 start_codon:yes stop_codon:yes gene_type:complete